MKNLLFRLYFITWMINKSMQELGSNLPKQHTSCVGIIKYTDFLLDTISGKVELIQVTWKRMIAAHTLCAIIPCMRLYYHLLRKIKDTLDPSDTIHPFKKLIDHYSSQDFEVCHFFFFYYVCLFVVKYPSSLLVSCYS